MNIIKYQFYFTIYSSPTLSDVLVKSGITKHTISRLLHNRAITINYRGIDGKIYSSINLVYGNRDMPMRCCMGERIEILVGKRQVILMDKIELEQFLG